MKNTRLTGLSARTALFTSVLTLCGAVWNAEAQFEITTGTGSTLQDFNTLSISGATNAFANDATLTPGDSTLEGWSLLTTAGVAISNYRADSGGATNGAFYSWGSSGNTERALGGIGSGGNSGYIVFAATNNSTSAITGLTLGFDGEQWRNGGATAPALSVAQTMVFEYGTGASFGAVTNWTQGGPAFNWTSPVFGTSTAAAVDGNVAGLQAGRGGLLSGLSVAVGNTLWLRWVEANDPGNDHGLAIDNFSLSWTPSANPPKDLIWTPTTGDWDSAATNWKDIATSDIVAFASGDTVVFDDTGLAMNTVTIAAGGVAPAGISVDTTGTYTITGGPIAAGGVLSKQGSGTLILGSAYAGGLNAVLGTVRTTANEVFGDVATVTLGEGAAFDLNGNNETIGAVTMTGATISTGAGTLSVAGNITVLFPTETAGSFISGKFSTVGSVTRKIVLSDGVVAEDLVLSADIYGSARIDFDGAGTVRISGNNSNHASSFQFDSGLAYILGSSNPLGTGQLFLNGGTVQGDAPLTGANKLTAPVSLGGGSVTFAGQNIEFGGLLTFFGTGSKTYTVSDAQIVTFSGILDSTQQPGQTSAPNGTINKSGPGKLVITGTATAYDATLNVTEGQVDITTVLGSGLATIHDGAAIVNISVSQTLADLTIDDGGIVTFGSPLPPAPALLGEGGLSTVPEPCSGIFLLGGLMTLLGLRRRGSMA